MSWGPQLGRSLSSWNSMIPAIILLWNQTNKNCAIPSMNDWACPTVHINLFATLCVSVCGDNNMCYSILPQNKEYYISNNQHFPPDQSLLRVLSLHTITLHSLGDPLLFPMKEKTAYLKPHCWAHPSVSGLWKSGCPWVAGTDTLSVAYLHLHIHEYMDYGCKLVTILLYVTCLMLCTFAEALSFSLIIIKLLYYACVPVCVCLSSFSCLAVISVY